jgi:hypothetical protein
MFKKPYNYSSNAAAIIIIPAEHDHYFNQACKEKLQSQAERNLQYLSLPGAGFSKRGNELCCEYHTATKRICPGQHASKQLWGA